MATTDAGLSSLALATYSNTTYYSTFFNGSTDYLSVPDNAALQLTGVFTIEAYVYFVTAPTTQQVWLSKGPSTPSTGSWSIGTVGSGSSITRLYYDTSGTGITFNTSLSINTWYHIAVVRDGSNVISCYINGVKEATTATVTTSFTDSSIVRVGVSRGGSAPWFNGYLSNVRILKGTALYTANFNAPTTQLTAIANTTLLICNTINIQSDGSVNNFTITKTGAPGYKQFTPALQVSSSATLTPTFTTGTLSYTILVPSNITAISVTPTANDATYSSIKFNGNVALTSGQANIAASGPYFANGYSENFVSGALQYANATPVNTQGYGWTVEFWVNPTGTYTANNDLFAKRVASTTTTAYQGYLTATTGYLSFYNGTAYTSSVALTPNVWSHVAYTYNGNTVSIFVNGIFVYSVVATVTDNAGNLQIGGASGYTEWTIGNISNFRMVKGYAIYSSNFTVPTQPLGLTQSSSAGVRAITGAPTNGYSVFFNGTTDYFTVPGTGGQFAFGTNNFTIEGWIYCNALGSDRLIFSVQTSWSIRVNSTGFIVWYIGVANAGTATVAITTGTWNHFAVVRSGTGTNQFVIYLNGAPVYTNTRADNITSTNTLYIGEADVAGSGYFAGYMSNLRIVTGTALYLSPFGPSIVPLSTVSNTNLLAFQSNYTADASANSFTITRGGTPSLSTINSPFTGVSGTIQPNGSSVYFNGSTNLTGSADFTATGDFTIECWFYPTVSTECDILRIGSEATGRIVFGTSAGNLFYNIYGSATVSLATNIPTNTWQHIAIVRSGLTITGYVNGVGGTPSTNVTGTLGNTSGFSIMTTGTGYISNLRYVNGTALYTTAFTPYTSPLIAITNTKLLALQSSVTSDASTNGYTLTASSPAPTLSSTISPFVASGMASTQFLSTALAYQQISNPYSPALSLGQGHNNFTAEAWVYLTATPPGSPGWYIIQKGTGATGGVEWSLSVTSTGLYFQTQSGFPSGTVTGTSISAQVISGQWMHLALTKVGTSVNIWFNGAYTGTINGVNNLFYTAQYQSYLTIANSQTSSTTAFSGYISNARVVYGKALYTVNYDATFTPTTTMLMPVQTGTSSIASIDNANSYTVRNGSSVYFNGTTDFLTFPEPAGANYSVKYVSGQGGFVQNSLGQLSFDTGDFTIETWFYITGDTPTGPQSDGLANQVLVSMLANSGTQTGWSFIIFSSGTVSGNAGIGFTSYISGVQTSLGRSNAALSKNIWYHAAISRTSGVSKLFINGVLSDTQTSTQNLTNSNYMFVGGTADPSYSRPFQGYMSSTRIIKGTGLYTASFTPSLVPLTTSSQGAIPNQVVALLNQNVNQLKDNSLYGLNVTNGNQTSATIVPFTSQYDVTVEAWVLLTQVATIAQIINNSATSTGYFGIAITASSRLVTVYSDSTATPVLQSTTIIPIYTWTHIAVVFTNSLITIFVNGVRDNTTATKTTAWQPATLGTVYIGRQASAAAQYFPGYISNLRMVYGTAVYTSKFTVPTSPLTNIPNTVFLGLQSSVTYDASINNATITKGTGSTGLVLAPLTSPFTSYIPSVANGYSLGFGWLAATPVDYLYFNVTAPQSIQLTGDFTVETWVYMGALPSTQGPLFDNRNATTDAGLSWYILTNGTMQLFTSNAALLTSTTVLAINTWYHLALTRQNGLIKFYINGIPDANIITNNNFLGGRGTTIYVGRTISGYEMSAYYSNYRIIQSTCIYTGPFTPSLVPYTTTSSSGRNTTAVAGITTYPAVGISNGITYSGSVYMDSTGYAVTSPSAGRYDLATFDFTIEAWFNCMTASYGGITSIVGVTNNTSLSTDYAWTLYLTKASLTQGTLTFQSYTGLSQNVVFTNTTPTLTINSNQWYHVASVRKGTIHTIYLNGVAVGIYTLTSGQYLGSTAVTSGASLVIGGNQTSGAVTQLFTGAISNVRVIRGYAVYTGNFVPSTSPLTNTQGITYNSNSITGTVTSLLALQNSTTSDASLNNLTLTATGSPTVSTSTYVFPVTNGYSANFINVGTGLLVSAGPTGGFNQLVIGTSSDYTVECWVYMTGAGPTGTGYSSGYTICSNTNLLQNGLYFLIAITNAGYLFMNRSGGSYITVNNTIPSMNTWTHLAFVNAGTVMSIYLNGVLLANTVSLTGTGPGGGDISVIGHSGLTAQASANAGQFVGYISNLRAVAGVQVYTGNFTVPTSPLALTQSSGTNINAITAGQTKLLMLQTINTNVDISNNNYLFYSNSPTLVTASTVSPFGGNSIYFTGSSQYITAPSNSVFTFGSSNNFTIEGWIYLASGTTTGTLYDARTGATTVSAQIYIQSNIVNYAVAGVNVITGTTLSTTTWYHIAVVRISNVTKLYVNGIQYGNSYTDNNNYVIGAPYIGTGYNSSNPLNGYISNLRVVNGTGVYSNNFVVPTSPLTNTQSSSSSIIALNNAIPSLGNSVYFNGSTDYMKVASNVTSFGTNDFTIEFYYFPTSFSTAPAIVGQYTATTTGLGYWLIVMTSAGIVQVNYNGSTNFTGSTAILINEWVHIALVRISGTITLYVNGTGYGSVSYATQFGLTSTASPVFIGAAQLGPSNYLAGYLSNLRIVNGVGVYTSAFTVPTSPLSTTQSSGTNIAAITGISTSLLLYQNSPYTDNSVYNNTVMGFGSPQYSPVFSPSFFSYPTPVNGNSGYFNGSTSYLSLTQPSNGGTGDLTIEMWIYPTSLSGTNYLLSSSIGVGTSTSNGYLTFNGSSMYATVPSNTGFAFGTGDFTVEMWIYTTVAATNGASTTDRFLFGAIGNTPSWTIYLQNGATLIPNFYSATGSVTSSISVSINTWTHIAVVRYSGTMTLYVNGVSGGTASNSTNYTASGTQYIARADDAANKYFPGNISNLRVVKGTAVYTGNFTVPSAPLTATQGPYTGTNINAIPTGVAGTSGTQLLAYQTGSVNDTSVNALTLTVTGGPTFTSTGGPFGSVTQGSFHLMVTNATGVISLGIDSNNPTISSAFPSVAKVNTWMHIAVVRISGTVYLYINGYRQTSSVAKSTLWGYTDTLNIGRYQPTTNLYFPGYISNIRFVYGTALYTGVYTTPPYNTPLSAVTNTTLLLLQSTLTKDNGPYNIAVTNNNVLLSPHTNPYTMMQLPVTLTAQVLSTTAGVPRDSSMYSATLSTGSNGYAAHTQYISPFGITPALLAGQSSMTRDDSINNWVLIPTTNTNIMPYVTPFNGSATAFNGATAGTVTGTNITNALGADFTIEFFMMAGPQTASQGAILLARSSAYNATTNNNYYIMCSHPGQGTYSSINAIYSTPNQTIQIYTYNTTGTPVFLGSTPVCDSKWHHIAIVRINGFVKVYIDGVLDTSTGNNFANTALWDYSNYTVGGNSTDGTYTTQLLYNGLISNLRITNGIGIYTGTFTPPTNKLTTTQNSGTNIVAYTPTTPSSTGYSWLLNTASNYVSISYPTTLNFGYNDYTIEFWHFLASRLSTTPCIFSNSAVSAAGVLNMYAGYTGCDVTKYQLALNGLTNPTLVANISMQSVTSTVYGKWTHVALVRRSGILYLYINGILDSTSGLGNYNVYAYTNWFIGSENASATSYLSGYISNFRAVNGIAVYTGNFTVPTSPLTTTQSSGTNIAAISNSLVTNGGAVYLPYASGYQYVNSVNILNAGPLNLTVEGWIYVHNLPSSNTWSNYGSGVLFAVSNSNSIIAGMHFAIGSTNIFVALANTVYGGYPHGIIPATWTHLAYVVSNGTITFYVNGISVGSASGLPAYYATVPLQSYIGTSSAGYNINPLSGYAVVNGGALISNLRIVKNAAVYTGNFLPSTSPLTNTQSAATNINAITGTSTSLLLQNSATTDLSTNAFTLTVGGSPSINTSVYPSFITTNAYSAYFISNGISSQYGSIQAPSTTSIVGNGTFTVECWIYPIPFFATTSAYQVIIGNDASGGLTAIGINPSGTIFYGTAPASGVQGTTGSTYTVTFNSWNHIAVVRNVTLSSSVVTIYINGQAGYTGTNTTSYAIGIVRIGTDSSGATYPYTGYISNIRIVNGVAVYTSNFSTPTGPLSTTQPANTNGNPSSALAVNTYAGIFNGTGQYLTLPNNATPLIIGNNNFTIECWIYPTTAAQSSWFVDFRPTGSQAQYPSLGLTSGTIYYFTSNATQITGSTASVYQWTHVALVRNNGITTLYINGGSAGTFTDTNSYLVGLTSGPAIGTYGFSRGSSGFTGYISNVRVVNGIAVYTGGFTPPTTQLTAIQSAGTNISPIGALTTTNGYYSNYFSYSTGPYLSLPGASFVFGTSAFTIECWVYTLSLSTTQVLIDNWVNSTFVVGQWSLSMNVTTGYINFAYATGTATQTNITTTIGVPVGQWTHVSAVRTSTSTNGFAIYVNGLLGQTATLSASIGTNATSSIGVLTSPKSLQMYGFISNVRLTNGVAVYTGAYIPQFTPLTTTQNAVTSNQSSLLALQTSNATLDSSTNAFAITTVGSPTIGTSAISPFPVTNGYSGFFSGSGQYLSGAPLVSNSLFTGDFTIELWAYCTNSTSVNWLWANYPNNNDTCVFLGFTAAGQLSYGGYTTYTTLSTTVSSVLFNAWTHIAFVRINGVETLYFNGTSVSTSTRVLNYSQGGTFYIGINPGFGQYFSGYMSNIRIVKGVGVYTGNFTPSTTPLTATQSSGTNIAAITATAPTNGQSVIFNGSSYLSTIGNSQLAFGTSQYTVEFYFYLVSAGSQYVFYDLRGATTTNTASFMQVLTNGTITYNVGTTVIITSSVAVVNSAWYHVAVVGVNQLTNGVTMYINGINVGTGTDTNNHSQFGLRIGQSGAGANSLNGYMSNFRIVAGVSAAVYTTTFAAPSNPLTAITNTKILVLQNSLTTDASGNNFTLTAAGTPVLAAASLTAYSPFASYSALLSLQNALTNDAGINSLTLGNTNGVTLSTSRTPFIVTNGNSIYFVGSSQYLQAPSDAAFTFGTNDFTIEGWIYLSLNTSTGTLYDSRTSINSVSPVIYVSTNRVYYAVGSNVVITGTTINTQTWYHIAISRLSGSTSLFVNGLQTSNIYADSNNYVIGSPYIGTGYNSSNPLTGYISNIRVVKAALYNSNFIQSNIPLSATVGGNIAAITGTAVSLLTCQSSTFIDNSVNAVTITNTTITSGLVIAQPVINLYANKGATQLLAVRTTDLTLDGSINGFIITNNGTTPTLPAAGLFNTSIVNLLTLQNSLTTDAGYYASTLTPSGTVQRNTLSPYVTNKGNSIFFNGVNQYIQAPSDAAFTFGTGNFTIEGWIYLTGNTTTGTLFDSRTDSSTVSPQVYITNNVVYYAVAGNNVITGATITAGTWYHVAIVRISSVTILYINGNQSGSTYADTNNYVIGAPFIGQGYGSSNPLTGYISNVRVVKGTGVYSSRFTTPANPLTVTQSSSANAIALTALPTTGYYSGYFDGTSTGTISFPNTKIGALSGSAFTIEAWVYFTTWPTSYSGSYFSALFSTTNASAVGLQINFIGTASSYTSLMIYSTSGAINSLFPYSFQLGTWYHVAVTRTMSGVFTVYVNGTTTGTTTNTSSWVDNTPYYIGYNSQTNFYYYFTGFISNFRITVGQSNYTSNFTPSTTPLTTTQSANTNGSPSLAIAQSTSTGYYDLVFTGNTAQYLAVPGSSYVFGTNPFTVECWVYATSFPASQIIVDNYTSATNGQYVIGQWQIFLTATTGTVNFQYAISASALTTVTTTTSVPLTSWTHIAVVRTSTTTNGFVIYINGAVGVTASLSSSIGVVNTSGIGLQYQPRSAPFYGYITNIRFTYGLAVYGSTFVPQSTPLTNTQSGGGSVPATLLALQSSTTTDGSVNNLTLTATGGPATTSYPSPFTGSATQQYGLFMNTNLYAYVTNSISLGSSDFTIEFWYSPYYSPTGSVIMDFRPSGTSSLTGYMAITCTVVSSPYVVTFTNGVFTVTSGTAITSINTFYHVAISKSNGTIRMFVNGTLTGSNADTQTYGAGLNRPVIGADYSLNNGPSSSYISTVRIVKGVGIYTSNFTTPTSPLQAIQYTNSNISAITSGQTVLLALNSATITADASGTSNTLVSNYSMAQNGPLLYPTPTNGGSVYFSGSGQYINAPSNSVFTFGTNNFTIEGWIYLYTNATSGTLFDNRTGASTVSPQIYISSSTVYYAVGGTIAITGATVTTGTWYHIAVVRSSGSTKLYVNGTQSGSTYTDSNTYVIGSPYFGTGYASSNPLNGFISNLRVTNGSAAYTTTFTPSTTPLTSSVSVGGAIAAISAPTTSNGYYATAYAGLNSQYLSVPGTPFVFGTNPFTVECWVFVTGFGASNQTVIDNFVTGGAGSFTIGQWQIWITPAGLVAFNYATSVSVTGTPITTNSVTAGVWTHIAVVRTNTSTNGFVIYINGVAGVTATVSQTVGTNITSSIGIRTYDKTTPFTGLISNLRITNIAVYTGAFTPPTGPLTVTQSSGTNIAAITGTSVALLMSQSSTLVDNSTFAYTITNVGAVNTTVVFGLFNNTSGVSLLTAQNSTFVDNSINGATITNSSTPVTTAQIYGLFGTSITALLALQNSLTTDVSVNNITLTPGSSVQLEKTFSAFGRYAVPALLSAQSGLSIDNSINSYTVISLAQDAYQTVNTPYGAQTPTALLTAQSSTFSDATGFNTNNITVTGASLPINTVNGPFNNDTALLTFQTPVVTDYSNNRSSMSITGSGAVAPTDNSPFTPSKSLTGLLIPYGYNDVSVSNATGAGYVANNATVAQTNFTYNPATIPSALVSVLGLQTSNTLLESSLNNSTFTTTGTAPTSSASSPFGTYNSNGILILNTSATTGLYSNITNYANLLVTANDTVTTNAYSITINALAPTATPNLRSYDSTISVSAGAGLPSAGLSNGVIITDVANSNITETISNANIANTNYVRSYDSAITTSAGAGLPNVGNIVISIVDVANSNVAETISNANIANTNYFKSYDSAITTSTGSGQPNVGNIVISIVDVANSNIAETVYQSNLGNTNYLRQTDSSIVAENSMNYTPTPVGGVILLITYSYTDGVVITAANVQSGSGSGTFAANTQIWTQT